MHATRSHQCRSCARRCCVAAYPLGHLQQPSRYRSHISLERKADATGCRLWFPPVKPARERLCPALVFIQSTPRAARNARRRACSYASNAHACGRAMPDIHSRDACGRSNQAGTMSPYGPQPFGRYSLRGVSVTFGTTAKRRGAICFRPRPAGVRIRFILDHPGARKLPSPPKARTRARPPSSMKVMNRRLGRDPHSHWNQRLSTVQLPTLAWHRMTPPRSYGQQLKPRASQIVAMRSSGSPRLRRKRAAVQSASSPARLAFTLAPQTEVARLTCKNSARRARRSSPGGETFLIFCSTGRLQRVVEISQLDNLRKQIFQHCLRSRR